jgi:2-hydroxychromene-2-carboxylate isomerase
MIEITLFTDPACPFAFSAEPIREWLRWTYGDQIRWRTIMIILTREDGEAEKLAEGAPGLQRRFGMPIDPRPYERHASSEPACRAVVAARLNAPAQADPLLRRLRVRVMQGGLLDDPALIGAAAGDVGLDPDDLARWTASDEVADRLEADAAAARDPAPAGHALDHKLGGPSLERRYTAPTYLIGDTVIPGFNPLEVYQTVIANLAPAMTRRPAPASAAEVLRWAPEPLATAELATILGTDLGAARDALRPVAAFERAGADGYWTLDRCAVGQA